MIESVYIHIPFCKTICTYCDFCKMYSKKEWIDEYLKQLELEIKSSYQNKLLKTIYIGGGTPNSLYNSAFLKLLKIVDDFKKDKNYEYTIECNIELLTEEQIKMMSKYGVNRVSLGVQTFNSSYLKLLNRQSTEKEVIEKIKLLKQYGITNINVDLMYAFPNQTIEDLRQDIILIKSLDIPHISTYSLMIEPNTMLYINKTESISEEMDAELYEYICRELKDYKHYEISNYSKKGYESKHNLTYWNNQEYYGFGLGASGYVKGYRYTNTRNLNSYLKGNYRYEEHEVSKMESMQNEMILGLRKSEGVSLKTFHEKYEVYVEDVFDIKKLLENKQLLIFDNYIKIDSKYIYTSNNILVNFVESDDVK